MATIELGQIICDDTDPLLTFRIPEDLLVWVEDCAEKRMVTVEHLINEMLYDYYGAMPIPTSRVKGGRNSPVIFSDRFHEGELIRRERIKAALAAIRRWEAKGNGKPGEKRGATRAGEKDGARVVSRFMDPRKWIEYELLREKNLRLLAEREGLISDFTTAEPMNGAGKVMRERQAALYKGVSTVSRGADGELLSAGEVGGKYSVVNRKGEPLKDLYEQRETLRKAKYAAAAREKRRIKREMREELARRGAAGKGNNPTD